MLLGLGAVAGFAIVWLATARYGAGISPDSVSYVSAARNLLHGEGLVRFDGRQFAHWPPLFPLLLALLGLAGIDPLVGGRLLNAAAFGACVPLAALILRRGLGSRPLVALGTVAVLTGPPLLYTATKIWTEPVFTLLLMLLVFFLDRWLTAGARRDFGLAAVVLALLPLQRYLGAVLVPFAGLAVLLWRPVPVGRRIGPALLLGGAALLPLGLWLGRNRLVAGTLAGERIAPATGPAESIRQIFTGLAGPFLPVVTLFVVLLAAVLVLPLVRPSAPAALRRLAAVLVTGYLAGLVVAALTTAIDGLDARMTAPLYPLVLLLLLSGLEDVFRRLRWASGRWLVTGLVAVWLVGQTSRSLRLVRDWREFGAGGYSIAAWQESPTVVWLRQNPVEPPVYSNAPDAAYILAGVPARLAPTVNEPTLPETGTLVSFTRMRRAHVLAPAELARRVELVPLVNTGDGAIMRIGRSR